MNFEPQTYEELIRMKRCVELTKYYEVTEEELWEIYHFLEQEPEVSRFAQNVTELRAKRN